MDYVMKKPNIVHIKGNHELFLQLFLEDNVGMKFNYERFGGAKVIREVRLMSVKERVRYHDYLESLPLYKRIQVDDREYVLTHSGFMADLPAVKDESELVDIEASIVKWCEISEYDYLISNDLHYIPTSIRFPFLIVGHYPTENLACQGIFFGTRYINIDNGLNITRGRKLACLRMEDMKEYYV